MTSPNASQTMQLVGSILGLQLISQTKQTELLLNGIQPFISL
jgi:hypothetical protein